MSKRKKDDRENVYIIRIKKKKKRNSGVQVSDQLGALVTFPFYSIIFFFCAQLSFFRLSFFFFFFFAVHVIFNIAHEQLGEVRLAFSSNDRVPAKSSCPRCVLVCPNENKKPTGFPIWVLKSPGL